VIALDANVIVRFLVRDDKKQAQSVYARFKQAEARRDIFCIPLVAVLETLWVLESAYGLSRSEILDALESLRRMPILRFEDDEVMQKLLMAGRARNEDLSDILIAFAAQGGGCDSGLTFDKKAARLPFFQLLT
jgi:predicted nucleic-acid-binding protein